MLRAPSNPVLNTSRDGASTPSSDVLANARRRHPAHGMLCSIRPHRLAPGARHGGESPFRWFIKPRAARACKQFSSHRVERTASPTSWASTVLPRRPSPPARLILDNEPTHQLSPGARSHPWLATSSLSLKSFGTGTALFCVCLHRAKKHGSSPWWLPKPPIRVATLRITQALQLSGSSE